jgi:hypothetical protein
MLKFHVCVTLACDACGRSFEGGTDLTIHYPDGATAAEEAALYDWFATDAGNALCGSVTGRHDAVARELLPKLGEEDRGELRRVYPHLFDDTEDSQTSVPETGSRFGEEAGESR